MLKASYTAIEQIFVAKNLYFDFLAEETTPATLLDSYLAFFIFHFCMTTLLQLGGNRTKLSGIFVAF